ncbi:hypothetical protein [Aeromicrobium sp. CF3.5]|uniref:hypothetical protein n=1 Tax=Aeromicrobium sp. CF3.5 TaxID=3373078 RepID=UPI003EE50CC8
MTIYARHTPLIARIADEIRARGASTHTVSIETGWVKTVSRALMVLDSPAGMSAARGLCEADPHGTRVVALLTDESDVDAEDLCDRCIERHDVVVLRSADDDVVERAVDELVGTSST